MGRFNPMALLSGLIALVLPIAISAQTSSSGQESRSQNEGAPLPAYRPGLGDLMTMTIQPRHMKLALAGREKNWTYAAYEFHELQEAFERAARAWPQWRSVPIADMITSVTQQPMADLGQAIKAADETKFAATYAQVTNACNTCHQSAGRGVIVIQVPQALMFPDQDFRPTNR
jgi:hypothetical protein